MAVEGYGKEVVESHKVTFKVRWMTEYGGGMVLQERMLAAMR